MSTKERQSNFELLRIVAMLFIVCHHLVIKGADTCGYVTPYTYEKDGLIGIFINSFVVGGGKPVCSNQWLFRNTKIDSTSSKIRN